MNYFTRGVQLSGGNRCFVRCPGCYNFFSNKDYSTNDLLDFLALFKKKTNISKITMAGGEPLARHDITEILRNLSHMGFKVNLDTVGLSLIKDVTLSGNLIVKQVSAKSIIQSVDIIGIPLDGSTDETQNHFRIGLKVSEILEVINVLSMNNARIGINTVVHKGNYDDIINIFNQIRGYSNIVKWQLFQFMPIGPGGFKNRLKYEISDEKFLDLRNKLNTNNDSSIDIQLKSRLNRKNKYLLIDGEGTVWIPKQEENEAWQAMDENNERILLGNIKDPNAVDDVLFLLKKYENLQYL